MEGLHAVIQKHVRVAPHHGPQHIALLQHLPDITQRLTDGPEFLVAMSEQAARARTPMCAARSLALLDHSAVWLLTSMCTDGQVSRRHQRDVCEVIYHCAAAALFKSYIDFPTCGSSAGGDIAMFACDPSYELLWRRHAAAFFREQAFGAPGCIFTLAGSPGEGGISHLKSVRSHLLRGGGLKPHSGFAFDGEMDEAFVSERAIRQPVGKADLLAFKVLRAKPSGMVTALSSKARLDRACMAICVHEVASWNEVEQSMCVVVDPMRDPGAVASSSRVVSLAAFTRAELLTLQQWRFEGPLTYRPDADLPPRLAGVADALLNAMLRHGAVADGRAYTVVSNGTAHNLGCLEARHLPSVVCLP